MSCWIFVCLLLTLLDLLCSSLHFSGRSSFRLFRLLLRLCSFDCLVLRGLWVARVDLCGRLCVERGFWAYRSGRCKFEDCIEGQRATTADLKPSQPPSKRSRAGFIEAEGKEVANISMPPSHGLPQRSISPQNSSTPLIPADKRRQLGGFEEGQVEEVTDPKTGQRRIVRRNEAAGRDDCQGEIMDNGAATGVLPQTQAAVEAMRPDSSSKHQPIPISPARMQPSMASTMAAISPSRIRSSSPRVHSLASSEIFERNVQEPAPPSSLGQEAHIPSHVLTEDHIPPVLEASAQAITSEELDPDEVEIVTTSSHQPATAPLENSASHLDLASLHSPASSFHNPPPALHKEPSQNSEAVSATHVPGVIPSQASLASRSFDGDTGSNYGALDPNDVRRLSFISFADVVQDEHHAHPVAPSPLSQMDTVATADDASQPNLPADFSSLPRPAPNPHVGHSHNLSTAAVAGSMPASPASTAPSASFPSPTPPAAGAKSPPRTASPHSIRSLNSATASPGQIGGSGSGLAIETMRQAVRKTASGDLRHPGGNSVGSAGAERLSPVGSDEGFGGRRGRGDS